MGADVECDIESEVLVGDWLLGDMVEGVDGSGVGEGVDAGVLGIEASD